MIWTDAIGFEGFYEVSSTGLVRRKLGKTIYKDGRIAEFSQTVLKPTIDNKGYCRVHLSKNSKKYSLRVHQIVAKAFIPNPLNKKTVNHIDLDKQNNNINNLEWATNKENI